MDQGVPLRFHNAPTSDVSASVHLPPFTEPLFCSWLTSFVMYISVFLDFSFSYTAELFRNIFGLVPELLRTTLLFLEYFPKLLAKLED